MFDVKFNLNIILLKGRTMKTELELNEMILALSKEIRENHPELLEKMDEMPITVPYDESPKMTLETLNTYYNSLLELVKNKSFGSKYTADKNPNLKSKEEDLASLPTPDIVLMGQETAYQDLLTKINSLSVSYHDAGDSEIPIIFIHGFPFDKSMWKGQMDYLKTSHRVIAYDLRGFGKTQDENLILSMDVFGSDLIDFMDKLNIQKAIVCGLSMGGYIALNAIKRFPERFTALILADTQCVADSPEAKENRYKTIDEILEEGTEQFNEKFIQKIFHHNSLTHKKGLVQSIQAVVEGTTSNTIVAGMKALAERSETCSILPHIEVPTLIICGRKDEVTPLSQSEMMHSQIRNSVLKVIENAGHVSNLEYPQEFNSHLEEFLKTAKYL